MKKQINLKESMNLYREYRDAAETAVRYTNRAQESTGSSYINDMMQSHADRQKLKAEAALKALTAELMRTVQPELDEVQKRAKVRTINAVDIVKALAEVEDKLLITKRDREGIEVEIDLNAQTFPNAYKGRPESTVFTAKFTKGCWKLTKIERSFVRNPHRKYLVNHTEQSKAALISRMTAWN